MVLKYRTFKVEGARIFRPIVEWFKTSDSKSEEPGFESQSGDSVNSENYWLKKFLTNRVHPSSVYKCNGRGRKTLLRQTRSSYDVKLLWRSYPPFIWQSRAVVVRQAHILKVVGSNPTSAILFYVDKRKEMRLCRSSPFNLSNGSVRYK